MTTNSSTGISPARADRAMLLEFYTQQGPMSAPGPYAAALDSLPRDVASLARIVHGLVVHEYMAPAYHFTVPDARKPESHIRRVDKMLEKIFALDPQPLDAARPVEKRLVGVCRHYALLLASMLRAKGVPARARCGFGAYFIPGNYEDHWVCEYWNDAESRWALADAQFDDVWIAKLKIAHDVLDVPRDQFLVAADAWTACRARRADADRFGVLKAQLRGLWFIATDLVHDAAALNKVEMLAWDAWGAAPRASVTFGPDELAYFDRLAALTREPDTMFDDLRAIYQRDERLRVPDAVFNASLNQMEAV